MTQARRNQAIGILIAFAIFAVDQAIKYWVKGPLMLRERGVIELVPFFDLHYFLTNYFKVVLVFFLFVRVLGRDVGFAQGHKVIHKIPCIENQTPYRRIGYVVFGQNDGS